MFFGGFNFGFLGWPGGWGEGGGGAQGRDRGRQRYSELNSSLSVLFWKVISKMKKTFLKKAAAAKAASSSSALPAVTDEPIAAAASLSSALPALTDAPIAAAASSSSALPALTVPPIAAASAAAEAGQYARVIDEVLGSGVAGEIVEIINVADESAVLCRVQKAGSSKVGRNVCLKMVQLAMQSSLPAPRQQKKLQLNQELRVELDMKFDADELGKSSALGKDSRLASMHLDMLYWMAARDLEIESDDKFCYFSPVLTAQLLYEMKLPEGEVSLQMAVATLTAKLDKAQLALVPVWSSEHWTMLAFKLQEDGKWIAIYKDSLTKECLSCRDAAEEICTVFSLAVNQLIQMPPRCNKIFQKVGSGTCGYYVMHWIEELIRCELGEGPLANGFPDPSKMFARLDILVNQIIKNKGIAALKSAKVELARKKVEEEAALEKEVAQKLAASAAFQAEAMSRCKILSYKTWASSGGCPKCRRAAWGSTCCNPDKIEAVRRARERKRKQLEELGKVYDGESYDAAVYKEMLDAVYAEIAAARGSFIKPPSLKKPGGGEVRIS